MRPRLGKWAPLSPLGCPSIRRPWVRRDAAESKGTTLNGRRPKNGNSFAEERNGGSATAAGREPAKVVVGVGASAVATEANRAALKSGDEWRAISYVRQLVARNAAPQFSF